MVDDDEESPKFKVLEDEDFVDPDNVEALVEALDPQTATYPLELPNGKHLKLRFMVCGQALSMEAVNGTKTGTDRRDSNREISRWIREINMALLDDWKFFNDRKASRKLNISARLKKRQIPVSIVTTHDWNGLKEAMFPGSFESFSDIKDGADAIRSGSIISRSRDWDTD